MGQSTLTTPSKTAAVSDSAVALRMRCWKPNQSNGLCQPEAKGRERGIDRDDGTVADRRRKTSLGEHSHQRT